MKYITIYVTFPNHREANKITDYLLEQKLIACATFLPIVSKFWWQDKINKASEVSVNYVTKHTHWENTLKSIKKLHSYDVPCIKKINFETTREYGAWINNVTTK